MALCACMGLTLAAPAIAKDVPFTGKTITPAAPMTYQQRIQDAAARFRAQQYEGLDREFKTILADPGFPGLAPKQRSGVLMVAAIVAWRAGDSDRARDLFLRSNALDEEAYNSYMLAVIELSEGQGDKSAEYLARAVTLDLAGLKDFHNLLVPEVLRVAKRGSEARYTLMRALHQSQWTQRGLGANNVWFDLAEASVERGDVAFAREVVGRIDGAMSLSKLRADKRFDALLAGMDELMSPAQAAQKRVEKLRALVIAEPDRLECVTQLMGALALLGEWNEILALSDQVQARIKHSSAPPYDDMESMAWVKEYRSDALLATGRTEEALKEMVAATGEQELDQANVSQVLNLGSLYNRLGRADEALAAIKPVGEMSGYGKMVQSQVHLRAALLKNDKTAARKAMRYLREHRSDAEIIYLHGLVASGLLEDAAKEILTQLDDRDTRADTLLSVQQFRELEPEAGEVTFRANWRALVARPEVRTAIERVGRVHTYTIYEGWTTQ